MFGYRWVQYAVWDTLHATAVEARTALAQSEARIARLLATIEDRDAVIANLRAKLEAAQEALLDAKGEARSKASMFDLIATRVNTLEHENATMRNRITGLPAAMPQIAKGTPLEQSTMGAGVDLFADVGDDLASTLKDQGLLHEEAEPMPFPSAAALTAGLTAGDGEGADAS